MSRVVIKETGLKSVQRIGAWAAIALVLLGIFVFAEPMLLAMMERLIPPPDQGQPVPAATQFSRIEFARAIERAIRGG